MQQEDNNFREFLTKERKCIVCNSVYTNKMSIGKLQCWEHWGVIKNGRFLCCGKSTGDSVNYKQFYSNVLDRSALGCIRADHRETERPHSQVRHHLVISKRMAEVMNCKSECVQTKDNANVYVHNYDRLALAAAQTKSIANADKKKRMISKIKQSK